jgi:hypothetical protein
MAGQLFTHRGSYRLLRDTVSASETILSVTNRTWAYFLANLHPAVSTDSVKAIATTEFENRAIICFDHNDNAGTAQVDLWAVAEGGPIEFVCNIDTITAGTQTSDLGRTNTSQALRFFSDTIGTITQAFVGGSGAVEEVDGGGNNRVSKIKFDLVGYKYLFLQFTTVSASDDVRAWVKFY